jgi:hypothetical protein
MTKFGYSLSHRFRSYFGRASCWVVPSVVREAEPA